MKKYLYLSIVLFLSLLLIACDDPDKDGNGNDNDDIEMITHEELFDIYNSTINEYMVSQNINIYMEANINNSASTIEFIYNLNGFNVNGLKYVSLAQNEVYEVYVQNGIEYINFNGNKSKNTLDNISEGKIITNYSFVNISKSFFDLFNTNLINSLKVVGQEDNVVSLEWDKSLYILDETSTSSSFSEIKENIKEIEVEITIEDEVIKSVYSIWKNKDGKTSELSISFRGIETNNITYPNDLESYGSRGK